MTDSTKKEEWVAMPCRCGSIQSPPKPDCGKWFVQGPVGLEWANVSKEVAHLIAASPGLLRDSGALVEYAIGAAVQIDGEWGLVRNWNELVAEGDAPQEILAVQNQIAKAEPSHD